VRRTLVEPLTGKEELALAILLWRSLRATFNFSGNMDNAVGETLVVNEESEKLAVSAGVRKEYYELLVLLPVLDITVKNLDRGGKREKRHRKGRRSGV